MTNKDDYLKKQQEARKDRWRIKILERLIPQTEEMLRKLPSGSINRTLYETKLHEYHVEYEERVGRPYTQKQEKQ